MHKRKKKYVLRQETLTLLNNFPPPLKVVCTRLRQIGLPSRCLCLLICRRGVQIPLVCQAITTYDNSIPILAETIGQTFNRYHITDLRNDSTLTCKAGSHYIANPL